jgi:hypothetical protein
MDVTCVVPFAVRYLSILDDESIPALLNSLPPPAKVAAEKAAKLCRFYTVYDTHGLDHPRARALAELAAHDERRKELAPPASDPVHTQWQDDRQRDQDRQRLLGQLHETKTALAAARDEAARLLNSGDEQGAGAMETTAAGLEERKRTLEGLFERASQPARRRDEGRPQRLKQQALDRDFAGENDQQLAEVYRRLGQLVFVDLDGQHTPASVLMYEASWRAEMAVELERRGVKRP